MEYFLIETNEKNKIPYKINKNRAIDIRLLTREKFHRISMWNMMEMDFPMEGFFPDLLCSPCILVSKCVMETIIMYQPDVPYKGVKLWNRESGANATYFMPVLNEVECISDETIYNNTGNRIEKLVLDREKIKPFAVFRIKEYGRNCIVGRLDFVESMLRREARGIELTLLDVEK